MFSWPPDLSDDHTLTHLSPLNSYLYPLHLMFLLLETPKRDWETGLEKGGLRLFVNLNVQNAHLQPEISLGLGLLDGVHAKKNNPGFAKHPTCRWGAHAEVYIDTPSSAKDGTSKQKAMTPLHGCNWPQTQCAPLRIDLRGALSCSTWHPHVHGQWRLP